MTLSPAPDSGPDAISRPITFSAQDGLRLFARHYPARRASGPPVLCLAGLTRNSRDFHDLAVSISTAPRACDVYALDSRGRGLSEFDSNWKNYSIPIEMQDVIDLCTVVGLHGATIIGTSRGGLIAMALAAARPTLIGAVVLNDIGPVIERDGLLRIAGYVGRTPLPASWAEAADLVASMSRHSFPAVPNEQWQRVARAWFNETDGRPAPGYDRRIARTFNVGDQPWPALWPQFEALARVPLLAIRGETSDLLSQQTLEEMQARHPDCATLIVPGQGHAPLLMDARTNNAVLRFLEAVDNRERVAGRDFTGEP